MTGETRCLYLAYRAARRDAETFYLLAVVLLACEQWSLSARAFARACDEHATASIIRPALVARLTGGYASAN